MKIEQSLLDRFIAARSSELTSEQVTAFFDGITLGDISVTSVSYDGTNTRLKRGVIISKTKKWRAVRTTWTNTRLSDLVKDQFKYTGELTDWLDDMASGKFYIEPANNTGQVGTICIGYAEGGTYDEASLWPILGALTGYDFSDMGTLLTDTGEKAHNIERIENPTADDSVIFNTLLMNRVPVCFRISGPVIDGIVLYVSDGMHNFAQDVDIGTVPGDLPAE